MYMKITFVMGIFMIFVIGMVLSNVARTTAYLGTWWKEQNKLKMGTSLLVMIQTPRLVNS